MSRLQITFIGLGILTVLTIVGFNVIYETDGDIPQADTLIKKESNIEPIEETKDPIEIPVISDKELIKTLNKLLRSKIRFAKDAKGYRDPRSMDYVKITDTRYLLCGTLLANNGQFLMDLVRNRSKNSEQFTGNWKYKVKKLPDNKSYAYLYGMVRMCETMNFNTSRPVYGSFEIFAGGGPVWFLFKEEKGQIIGKVSVDGQSYGYNKITTGWYPPYYYR
jgi:hypothetical protein